MNQSADLKEEDQAPTRHPYPYPWPGRFLIHANSYVNGAVAAKRKLFNSHFI